MIHKSIRRAGEKKRRKSKVVGLIPARSGSKGLPYKNLLNIAGYPLVAHSVMALTVAGVRPVYVSTECVDIADVARRYGAQIIDRPEDLATDKASTESVVLHFLDEVECDVVVLVQCTSPMLQPKYIVNGINKFFACGLDSCFSAVRTNDTLIWDGKLNPWNYDPRKRGQRQRRKNFVYIETGAFYIFTRRFFQKHRCRVGGLCDYSEVPFWQSFQVDNKHDYQMIRKLMER